MHEGIHGKRLLCSPLPAFHMPAPTLQSHLGKASNPWPQMETYLHLGPQLIIHASLWTSFLRTIKTRLILRWSAWKEVSLTCLKSGPNVLIVSTVKILSDYYMKLNQLYFTLQPFFVTIHQRFQQMVLLSGMGTPQLAQWSGELVLNATSVCVIRTQMEIFKFSKYSILESKQIF